MNILIGHTGFVGSNLAEQHGFDGTFNSRNIEEARNRSYELVVCAGVQAKKWWANQNPAADWDAISKLLDVLRTITAKEFILISTVDVYARPLRVTELDLPTEENHAYGKNRLAVESFVRRQFERNIVVRLPGLFGRNLRKNVIFDLLNSNCLDKINPMAAYQYYDLRRLWRDLEQCRSNRIDLLNVATPPIRTSEIVTRFFPEQSDKLAAPAEVDTGYDMRTVHSETWKSAAPGYLYSKEDVLRDMSRFIEQLRKQ